MKYIQYIFLLILLSFCKDDKMNSVSSLPKVDIKTKKDKPINSNYSQIPINCDGEQFAPTNCGNNGKNLFYKFSVANNKSFIEFKYKNETFNHSLTESISELGINSFLFENESKMILIIDSFLEYGHTFYVYQFNIDTIKYIGSKSFDVKLDKNEIELKYNFNVSETNNKLILKLGSGYDDINLNISDSFILPIKDNLGHKESQIEDKWFGIYKGSFLQFKEEYNDPRSWATVYINITKDSLIYELHSLREESSKLELINKETNSLTFKMNNGSTLKISNINNGEKYILEGSQMVKLIKDESSLDLTKE
ncbi:hypothetical protein [Flavobacterium hibisci]|uniref:hypothetical protein n=1 Tax=Flavobacterium hibisci TaxID=1914462 RepID=UPI001CBD222D|nr:hypothetical protein [Flavobacterium hibisci]MBZ4043830.1 hypothetical protein [Flavobacterium hibisci]